MLFLEEFFLCRQGLSTITLRVRHIIGRFAIVNIAVAITLRTPLEFFLGSRCGPGDGLSLGFSAQLTLIEEDRVPTRHAPLNTVGTAHNVPERTA
jgi:hypothetical protein